MNFQSLTRRFARLTTDIVVRWPRLWFLLRPVLRFQFDRLAPQWDAIRDSETAYAPYEAALEGVEPPPRRALDLGTGTGERPSHSPDASRMPRSSALTLPSG